jgi:hypothetical protein
MSDETETSSSGAGTPASSAPVSNSSSSSTASLFTEHEHAGLTSLTIPWDRVATFLPFEDILSARLCCKDWLWQWHELIGPDQTASWLSSVLLERNLYLAHDIAGNHWKSAAASTARQAESLERLFLPPQSSTVAAATKIITSTHCAMDVLLRYLRVMHYLPQEAAVCYSGKSGRHCRPIVPVVQKDADAEQMKNASHYFPTKLYTYPPCHRGKRRNCPTCRVKIPAVRPTEQRFSDGESGSDEEQVDGEEQQEVPAAAAAAPPGDDPPPPDDDPPPVGNQKLDDFYQIQTSSGEHLRLDTYINKCIPNLPSDLTCPICRVTNQRTLQLTEVTYQSAPGTQRREHVTMPLTLTPNEEEDEDDEDDDQKPQASSPSCIVSPKRRRLHQDPDDATNLVDDSSSEPEEIFPPIYQELFIPTTEEFQKPAEDCKTAISIHCQGCRQFAVIAPAVACLNSKFPCHSKTMQSGDPAIVIGGVLTRTRCRVSDCGCAALCRACSSLSKTMHYSRDNSSIDYRLLQCRNCKRRCCLLHERQNANCSSCSDADEVLTRRFTSMDGGFEEEDQLE